MAMEKYEKLEKVGEGTYGKVYKARCKATGQLVALKKTRLDEDDEEGVPPTALREISLLQMLSQDVHVVRLMDVEHGESKKGKPILYLIFEFLDCDLKTYIDTFRKSRTKIPLKIIKSFMYQLCQGVNFCHSRGVMHRDLKPRNLLVDKEKGLVKVADLGLGRAFTVPLKQYTHEILTLWYRAPEVLLGATHYSTPVDMWSVGCIFAELYNTHALFQGDCEINQLFHIFRYLGTPNEEVWPGVTKFKDWHEYPQWKKPKDLSRLVPDMDQTALDMLAQMFVYDPAKRISARKALVHPYFDDFDKSSMPKLL